MKCFALLFFLNYFLKIQAQDWTKESEYFPVYTFSPQIVGLTVELTDTPEGNNIVNAIFNQVDIKDSLNYKYAGLSEEGYAGLSKEGTDKLADSTGQYKFYWNAELQSLLLKNIHRHFFVYCTKGIVERKIKDVVFALDQCQSSVIVFRFDKIDTNQVGHPVFCSVNHQPMIFKRDLPVEKTINDVKDIIREKSDYKAEDSLSLIVFAKMDSFYFVYKDNFDWQNATPKCYFPERSIYLRRNDALYCKMDWSLDLFGTPCD